MHVADGILSTPVLIGGAAAGTVGVAYGLYRMKPEEIPQTAVLSSAFFVASLIHVPVPPASAHLVLVGLLGLVLGWSAVPAIFVGLLLQYVFFSHGGLTTLGVNTVCMGLPAVLCHCLLRRPVRQAARRGGFMYGAIAGAVGIGVSAFLVCLCLYSSEERFLPFVWGILAYHVPLMLVEALVTGTAVSFLRQVRPEVFAVVPQPAPEAG